MHGKLIIYQGISQFCRYQVDHRDHVRRSEAIGLAILNHSDCQNAPLSGLLMSPPNRNTILANFSENRPRNQAEGVLDIQY